MNRDDDSFEWKLLLPVGTMMWSGKIDDHSLKMFTLKWSTPIGTIDMNLVEDGEFIRGPLMVKQWDSEILQANVWLKMKKGNFGFDIDVLTPEGTGSALKTILDVTYNSKKFTDSIDVPSPVTAFSEFLKELETIVPKEELPILMDSGSAIQ